MKETIVGVRGHEGPWSMYDDGDNTVSIEVHRPPDDAPVTLPIRVNPEKQLHVILVPQTPTRYSSPVAPEFVSQSIMPFRSPTTTDVEGQEESRPPPVAGGEAETSDCPSSTRTVSSTITNMPVIIDMNQDTSDSVDMVSESPPTTITTPEISVVVPVSPDGSRPHPVVGGVAEPQESESPPSTITTPELPPARTSAPLPSTPTSGRHCSFQPS